MMRRIARSWSVLLLWATLLRECMSGRLLDSVEWYQGDSVDMIVEKRVSTKESAFPMNSTTLGPEVRERSMKFKYDGSGRVELKIFVRNEGTTPWLKGKIQLNKPPFTSGERVELSPTSNEGQVIIELFPELLAGGHYAATFSLQATELDTKEPRSEAKDFALRARISADPDPYQSSLDISPCTAVNWTDTCTGYLYLKDVDGFWVKQGYSNFQRVNAEVFKVEAPKEKQQARIEHSEDGSNTTVSFTVFTGGQLDLVVRIGDVYLPNARVEAGCGDVAYLDAEEKECICSFGFQPGKNLGCERCGACPSGEILDKRAKNQCICIACDEGMYCPTQQVQWPCPPGTYCPKGSSKPEACPVDSYTDRAGLGKCTRCSEVGERSSTLGVLGADTPLLCTRCPENANCNASLPYALEKNASVPECPLVPSLKYKAASTAGLEVELWENMAVSRLVYVAVPEPGYFRFPTLAETNTSIDDICASAEFLACPGGESRCPGGLDDGEHGGCAEGYAGFLCGACQAGYAISDSECVPCTNSKPYIYAVIALVLILILTGVMAGSTVRKSHKRFHTIMKRLSQTTETESRRSDPTIQKSINWTSNPRFVDIQGECQDMGEDEEQEEQEEQEEAELRQKANPIMDIRVILSPHIEDTLVSVLKIAYSHLQVIALLLSLDVDWHESVHIIEKISATFAFTSTDVTSSVMCLFSDNSTSGLNGEEGFYGKVLFIYLLPFGAALVFALLWGLFAISKAFKLRVHRDYYHGFELTVMIFLFLIHILLVRTALELFVCTSPKVHGRSFLVAEPRIECFEGSHVGWFILAGLGGLLFYGAGIPWLSAKLVRKESNCYLGVFLCKNFRKTHRWWESVVAARKVILTMFMITLEKFGPRVQGIACLSTLFVSLLVQVLNQPFVFLFLNQLETCGIITAILTLILALYSVEFNELENEDNIDLGLNVAIAALNFVFLFVLCYELVMVSCHVASNGKLGDGFRRRSLEPLPSFLDPKRVSHEKSRASSSSISSKHSRASKFSNTSNTSNISKPSSPTCKSRPASGTSCLVSDTDLESGVSTRQDVEKMEEKSPPVSPRRPPPAPPLGSDEMHRENDTTSNRSQDLQQCEESQIQLALT